MHARFEVSGSIFLPRSEAPCLAKGLLKSYSLIVSVAEIMKELPKLSARQRSEVRRRLQELEEKDEMQFLNASADAMFREMDKSEAKGAHRKAR